jgi:hypothetical protein
MHALTNRPWLKPLAPPRLSSRHVGAHPCAPSKPPRALRSAAAPALSSGLAPSAAYSTHREIGAEETGPAPPGRATAAVPLLAPAPPHCVGPRAAAVATGADVAALLPLPRCAGAGARHLLAPAPHARGLPGLPPRRASPRGHHVPAQGAGALGALGVGARAPPVGRQGGCRRRVITKLEEIAKVKSFVVRRKDWRVSLEGTRESEKGPLIIRLKYLSSHQALWSWR